METELLAALEKLVYLKDMKDRLEKLHSMGHGTDYDYYHKHKPLAWAEARRLVERAKSTQGHVDTPVVGSNEPVAAVPVGMRLVPVESEITDALIYKILFDECDALEKIGYDESMLKAVRLVIDAALSAIPVAVGAVTDADRLDADSEKYQIGYLRYEYLRTLNPQQFTSLHLRNISGHGVFDDLVDAAIAAQREGGQS